jgi:hypothetical protein
MTNNQPTRVQKTIGPHVDADPSVAQLADVPVHVVDPDEDAPEEGQDPSSVAPC